MSESDRPLTQRNADTQSPTALRVIPNDWRGVDPRYIVSLLTPDECRMVRQIILEMEKSHLN